MPPKKRLSGTSVSKEPKAGAERRESPELSVRKHKDKDSEFLSLCTTLGVTEPVCERAWMLWKAVAESADKPTANQKQLWAACLYVTVTDAELGCFTLTQLLKAVDLNVTQFLVLVKKLDVNLDTISSKVNAALTRLEKKFDVMLALYQRYEKMCKKIFVLTADGKERETLHACWTFFLLAKGKALQMEDDLVISFQLLLCTLELFIKHCPAELLQPLYKPPVGPAHNPPTRASRRNQNKAKPRPVEPEAQRNLLETLSRENQCNAEEVKNVYQSSFTPFLDSLHLSSHQFLDTAQVKDINQQYEEHYLKSRDIDGRLFFLDDETVVAPKAQTSQTERTPKKNISDEEGPLVPPQTPIRAAMTSIQLLRGELPSSGEQPSPTLASYFKQCTVDPTQDVRRRLESLGQVFSQRFGQAVGPHCVVYGQQRFSLGVRKYYQVMEAMLKSEEKRLSVQNFSKLLNNATFHTSLLACALEVVMAAYKESTLRNGGYTHGGADSADTDVCFPWILHVFELAAFDFYKVIESFIKADHTLSKTIIKHLESCENLIMERIAWKTGSVLFELLGPGGGAMEQVETPASFSQPLQHSHTAADLYLSPLRPSLRVSPPDSPATPSSPPSSQATAVNDNLTPRVSKSNSLSLFYKKLYRLAYTRLKLLCSFLLPSRPDLELIIWTLFQHTLQHEHELLRDRHLDQLMMSAMYAICKVKSVDLRFKTIVHAYKNMPNTSQETFKHVLIADRHFDSIIIFYNQVFMQRLKTNILQYASTRPPTLSPIPQIPRSPYKFPNSPLRVPVSNNVYISPLKSPRMSPGIMTPRSKMLVSIGESFGQCNRFQKINQMVNSGERSLKRTLDLGLTPKPLKRLRFDVDGSDEADGGKSGSDSTLIQKLAEMSSTRSRMQEQKMKEDAAASGKDAL